MGGVRGRRVGRGKTEGTRVERGISVVRYRKLAGRPGRRAVRGTRGIRIQVHRCYAFLLSWCPVAWLPRRMRMWPRPTARW